MRRLLTGIGLSVVFTVSMVSGSPGAEAIRLRPANPIYLDEKGAGIRQPEGVGCAGKSLFLVADTGNGRILPYTVTGNSLTPGASILLPEVPYPIRVQADSKEEIYALDGKLRRIARLSLSGEFRGYVDLGAVPGGTVIPRSFRIGRDDNLYILDVFSARLLVLDLAGKVLREIPFPKEHGFFSDLALDPGGTIYLIDSVGKRVYSAPKGTDAFASLSEDLEGYVNFPISLAVDGRGIIYVIDQNGGSIVILGPDGSFRGKSLSMGWKNGFLLYPSQACIDDNGNFFIANRGNNRVEVLFTAQ